MKIPLRLYDLKKVKKTGRGYTRRELTVVSLLKELTQRQRVKSLLNVGFHDYRDVRNRWWIDICRKNHLDWQILEIFEPNVKRFKEQAPIEDHHRIHLGDIKNIASVFSRKFDVILHWHGPEHLTRHDFLASLPDLLAQCSGLLVFGCPNGEEDQAEAYGNPYERHLSFWRERDFHGLGLKTITVTDKKPGHITAYTFVEAECQPLPA